MVRRAAIVDERLFLRDGRVKVGLGDHGTEEAFQRFFVFARRRDEVPPPANLAFAELLHVPVVLLALETLVEIGDGGARFDEEFLGLRAGFVLGLGACCGVALRDLETCAVEEGLELLIGVKPDDGISDRVGGGGGAM